MMKPELEAIINDFYIDSERGRIRSQEFAFAFSHTVQVFVNGALLQLYMCNEQQQTPPSPPPPPPPPPLLLLNNNNYYGPHI
jgi:hypothetical protein